MLVLLGSYSDLSGFSYTGPANYLKKSTHALSFNCLDLVQEWSCGTLAVHTLNSELECNKNLTTGSTKENRTSVSFVWLPGSGRKLLFSAISNSNFKRFS